jgi:glycerol uptake facilitator-like aquaporin
MLLVLCVMAITDAKNMGVPKGLAPVGVGLVIMVIGMTFGANCGYPINPARDLAPRLFTAIAGYGGDCFSLVDNDTS